MQLKARALGVRDVSSLKRLALRGQYEPCVVPPVRKAQNGGSASGSTGAGRLHAGIIGDCVVVHDFAGRVDQDPNPRVRTNSTRDNSESFWKTWSSFALARGDEPDTLTPAITRVLVSSFTAVRHRATEQDCKAVFEHLVGDERGGDERRKVTPCHVQANPEAQLPGFFTLLSVILVR